MAWQLCIADVESRIVESQCRRGQDLIEKRVKKQERLEKIAATRRENRQKSTAATHGGLDSGPNL